MQTILSIETTTKVCSVAVVRGTESLFLKETFDDSYKHAEQLHVFIKEATDTVGIDTIDAIAVSKGPGSYTGLRIGVSAAKGLCFALNKPLLTYCPLEAILAQIKKKVSNPESTFVAFMDARRMEVYQKMETNGEQTKTIAISPESNHFDSLTSKHICIGGDGAEKFEGHFTSEKTIEIIPNCYPSAYEGAILAGNRPAEDVAYFEPFYLKDFKTTTPKSVKL